MGHDVVFDLAHTKIAGLQWSSSSSSSLNVISLHGWLDNAASFQCLAPYLSRYSHCSLDFSGHGLSDHRSAGSFYHLWDYVLDTVSVLNLSDQSSWLVGHSMGAAVAMMVAAVAPEKVRGLIILDNVGPLIGEPTERVVTLKKSIQKMAKQRLGRCTRYHDQGAMVSARMKGFTSLSREAALPLVSRGSRRLDDDWVWRHDSKLNLPSPFRMDEACVEAFIAQVQCPTLALMAEEGIFQNNVSLVKRRTALFSDLTLKWLEGNHHFHLEPETASLVALEVQRFIDLN